MHALLALGIAIAGLAAETALVRVGVVNGSGREGIAATAVDGSGNMIVAGTTTSVDLPGAVVTRLTAEKNLLRSVDSGRTWRPGEPAALGSPEGFASHPSRPNVVVAGGAAGIYRSSDGGVTWRAAAVDLQVSACGGPVIAALAHDPRNPDVFYAGGGAGVLRSSDGGQRWELVSQPRPFPVTRLAVDPFDSSILMAETEADLLRSVDGGRRWDWVITPGWMGMVAFDRRVAGQVFAYARRAGAMGVSLDHGVTWSIRGGPAVGVFRADGQRPDVYWVISWSGLVYRSENAGLQWSAMGSVGRSVAAGFPASPAVDFAASPKRAGVLVVATNQGILGSEDEGKTWIRRSELQASRLFFTGEGDVLASLTPRRDIFVSKIAAESGEVLFTTYLGGEGLDSARGVGVDGEGNIVVAGRSESKELPVPGGGFADEDSREGDVVVFKLSPGGERLLYTTRLGGAKADEPAALFVDRAGNAYVAGATLSEDWPTSPGALQPVAPTARPLDSLDFDAARNGFVAKLDAQGGVVYSTLIGGARADSVNGIVVDGSGNAWVTGWTKSPDFPVSADAAQRQVAASPTGAADAFVTQLNAAGSAVLYSTVYGGAGAELGNAIALDEQGSVYVAGESWSAGFPATAGAFHQQHQVRWCMVNGYGASADGFVLKLEPDRRVGFATLMGSKCYLSLRGIAVAGSGLVLAGDVNPSGLAEESYPFYGDPVAGTPVAFVGEMDREGKTFALGPLLPGAFPSIGLAEGGRRLHAGLGMRGYTNEIGESAYVATLERRAGRQPLRLRRLGALADGSIDVAPGDLAAIEMEGMEGVEFRDLGINAGRDLPEELSGVRVWFDGHAARILLVAPNRVVCVVPSGLRETRKAYSLVEVALGEARSGPWLAWVVPGEIPKILMNGQGWAVARNEDGTENSESNPARVGSVVTFYATGLGPLTPPVADGSVATAQVSRPVARVEVMTASFAELDVVDVSTMPGFVSALLQIKVRAPEPLVGAGGRVAVRVSANWYGSNAGAIAVK